ncbi:FecR family protein [Paracoccus limosus]|nr:FecR family protein [Paracoccus limosus]
MTSDRDEADRIFAEAARWHLRLREAEADAHDAFMRWIAADPRHLPAFDRAQALWQALAPPAALPDPAAIAALLAEARPRRARRAVLPLVLALLAGLGLWQGPDLWDSLRADHIAWTGQRRQVTLADGTRVDLNSGAALAVDFTPAERRVRLLRGEAFFQVAHDAAHPFVVEMPNGALRVTGTSFDIDLTPEGDRVALVEGSVRLLPGHGGAGVTLAPGQQAELRDAGISPPGSFDADSRTAWRQGRMVFYRTPLSQVVAELARYRRGPILLLNDRVAELPVTGAFSTADPDAAIRLIAETLGLSTHHLAGALTVIR